MKRVGLSLAVLLLTVFGLFLPVINFSSSDGTAESDPMTISDWRSEYDVSADGRLQAVETITAEFPYGRHGIFRQWDIADQGSDQNTRYVPEDVSVTMDGASVPVEMLWEQGRRIRVAKIGDPNSTVSPGRHTYVVKYHVDGVLAPGDTGGGTGGGSWGSPDASVFIWRLVPTGRQMPVERSESVVNLPEAPTAFTCSTNRGIDCKISKRSDTSLVVTTGSLAAGTGLAVRVDLPSAAPDQVTVPWSVTLDPVLGRSLPLLIVILIVSALTCAAGLWWALRSRESEPLLPVMYEPPADPRDPDKRLGPAQTFYVAYERLPRKALVATLFNLAERGAVRLERHGDDWSVISQMTPEMQQSLDPAGLAVINALGLGRNGAVFAADGSVGAGRRLGTAQSSIDNSVRTWGAASNTVQHSSFETLGKFLVIIAIALAVLMVVFGWAPATVWMLPLAGFAIGAAGLWDTGVGTRRTKLGREVWSRAGGFERLLSTRSNQERLDFSARKDLFTDFIPYAIAFDCADAWADKYRYATNQEPPDPIWFGPGFYHTSYFGGFGGGGSAFDSFESSLSSSMSAYSASKSSNSGGGFGGGGGGFSGGGGGGGVGSW
ncbi:DUF2207 domain-containing protein [Gordonia sp. VNK21]|uniref:DUF2207 domain-containing protein n=1 Tax=Gordonia sp. VNK21 TaxID=3382483 RepID=UPI0038D4D80E